jgi:chromate transporter
VVALSTAGAVFVAIGVMRWPMPPVLLVAIPASIAVVYLLRRRATP